MSVDRVGYVTDTNVLVSAALGDGPARRVVVSLAWRGQLVASRVILDELADVLSRAPFHERLRPRVAARFPAFAERRARLVEPAQVSWPGNPDDAVIIATALAADRVLVTGDKDVLDACERFEVRGITVREALAELGA